MIVESFKRTEDEMSALRDLYQRFEGCSITASQLIPSLKVRTNACLSYAT